MGGGEVGGDEAGWIDPPGGAQAGENERHLGLLGGQQQVGLGIERINGIDQDIARMFGEELGRGPGVEEEGEGGDVGVGVDIAQEAGGGGGLFFSEGGMEGEGMAIEVGGADFVEVDQDEMSDGGAGEGFGGGGADGAKARDQDAGAGQAREGCGAEEEFQAGERRGHREQFIAGRKQNEAGRTGAAGRGRGRGTGRRPG